MSEENKAIVRRFFEEVWNGDLAVADEIFSTDFAFHSVTTGDDLSIESIKRRVTAYRTGFPDLRITVEDQLAEGDKVAARVVWRGTHQGEYRDIAATGKKVEWTGTVVFRISGGKIVERWGNTDTSRMQEQLSAANN